VRIEFERAGRDCAVEVEIGVNDDPAALGCPEIARGYPVCEATVSPLSRGYAGFLGWVQLVDSDRHGEGFHLDHFEPLGPVPHPFAMYGFPGSLFDAPHSDFESWTFLAHSFLCGCGADVLDGRKEIEAVLGFSWGFRKSRERMEILEPSLLASADWDRHHPFLEEAFPDWTFLPGFSGRAAER
jgi:hypothetical protein